MPTESSDKGDTSGEEEDTEIGEDGSGDTEESEVENDNKGSGDDKTDGERQTRRHFRNELYLLKHQNSF